MPAHNHKRRDRQLNGLAGVNFLMNIKPGYVERHSEEACLRYNIRQ